MRPALNILLPAVSALFALLITGAASVPFAHALSPGKSPELAPHRAVYELSLADADRSSGVIRVKGRLVFEFSGNACEGYTQNMRFVTQVFDRRGSSTLTDLRSSSWEDGAGKRFRFNSNHYRDRKLKESVKGDAVRSSEGSNVEVALTRPKPRKLRLSDKILFPYQHSIAILEHAFSGDQVLQARIYDGSEKGEKVFDTTTIIGKLSATEAEDRSQSIAGLGTLKSMKSWPVAISYFEGGQSAGGGEQLPVYELGFRIYANGVSRNLIINYGDFSIRGALTEIEFFKSHACQESAGD